MDLYNHDSPGFTRWVAANGYLHEPLIVIDAGVQGGEHPRWKHLGPMVRIYGFDPIAEVIAGLQSTVVDGEQRKYFLMGLGNEDCERDFYVAENSYGSSFFPSPQQHAAAQEDGRGRRTVSVRKLDTLFAEGTIPAADYIKIDCEGFDPEVVRGARNYLARSNILCVSVETGFGISPVYRHSGFAEINQILVEHRLSGFDFNCVRAARAEYVAARARRPWPKADPMGDAPDLDVGQPGTFDFVFCRDYASEQLFPHPFDPFPGESTAPTVDKLIKAMVLFELHGLMDCGVQLAERFRESLAARMDVDKAIDLLVERPPHARNTADVVACLRMIAELRTRVLEAEAAAADSRAALAAAAASPPAPEGWRRLLDRFR
jgi:FkbM family methyltransferase